MLAVLFTLAGVWVVLMAFRGVRIDESGVTLRYCIKRRHLPLAEVVGFGVAEFRNLMANAASMRSFSSATAARCLLRVWSRQCRSCVPHARMPSRQPVTDFVR